MPYLMSIGFFLFCWRPGISFPMPHAMATMLPCIVLQYVIFGEGDPKIGIGRQATGGRYHKGGLEDPHGPNLYIWVTLSSIFY